jgi:hypothetical protein
MRLATIVLLVVLVFSSLAISQNSASVDATAQLIGVLPELSELKNVPASTSNEWRILWLHQHVSEKVLAASLQVDAAIAQIDNEIARASEIRSYLADRRDRTVNRLNLVSVIIGGGLGATSSGLQLSSTLNKPAAGVGIGAGTVSSALAIAGVRAQKGGTSRFDFESNMLSEFFDRPSLPDSRYPAIVWAFLNQAPESAPAGTTRKQQLIQTWLSVRRIDSLESAGKIQHLTSQPSEQCRLTVDDFEDRAAMLQDVRARIFFLKRDLASLLSAMPPVTFGQ